MINVYWLYVPFWLHGVVGADLRPDIFSVKKSGWLTNIASLLIEYVIDFLFSSDKSKDA
jgi:hypothetical protein